MLALAVQQNAVRENHGQATIEAVLALAAPTSQQSHAGPAQFGFRGGNNKSKSSNFTINWQMLVHKGIAGLQGLQPFCCHL